LNGWEHVTQSREYRVLVKVLQPGSVAHQARTVVRRVLENASIDSEGISDAESAVAELAANAESHARGPYELRIINIEGRPEWCEIVDGDQDLNGIPEMFQEAGVVDPCAFWFQESGRGLLLVSHLSAGQCLAYQTTMCATGVPGKAVAFRLPRQGVQVLSNPLPLHSNGASYAYRRTKEDEG
jgi:anti-sigma regulatory factor (Ser/Thr protein kinase)